MSIDTGRSTKARGDTAAAPERQASARAPLLAELERDLLARLGSRADSLRIERAVLGIFFTGVKLDNGAGGLCATPIRSVPEAVCCPSSARAMPTPGARVALVGAFPPYMRELRRRGQPFNVLELDPATLEADEVPYFVPAERAPEAVPHADVLITTGTALANGSLDGLLDLLRPGADAAVVGPTATLYPPSYAARGVTVLGGTRVVQPDALLDVLAEGGSGYHFFEKSVERVTLRLVPR